LFVCVFVCLFFWLVCLFLNLYFWLFICLQVVCLFDFYSPYRTTPRHATTTHPPPCHFTPPFRYLSHAGTHVEARRHGRWWASVPRVQWPSMPGGEGAGEAAFAAAAAAAAAGVDFTLLHHANTQKRRRTKRVSSGCGSKGDGDGDSGGDDGGGSGTNSGVHISTDAVGFGDRYQKLVFIGELLSTTDRRWLNISWLTFVHISAH
jgi:hypothetical protein